MGFNKKIILVGLPNVGKSALFYRLTGTYADVSNYPGTTVEIFRAPVKIGGTTYEVIDTPGVNSLWHQSEDERVTSMTIKNNPDALVIAVCDSVNYIRSMILLGQIAELKRNYIAVFNLYDEALSRGIRIDFEKIKSAYRADAVLPTVAVTGEGVVALKETIRRLETEKSHHPPAEERKKFYIRHHPAIEHARKELERFGIPAGWDIILLASFVGEVGGGEVDSQQMISEILRDNTTTIGADSDSVRNLSSDAVDTESLTETLLRIKARLARPPETLIFETYYMKAAEVAGEAVSLKSQHRGGRIFEKIGILLMRPAIGYPAALAALYAMYLFVGVFAAGTVVDFMEEWVFGKGVNPFFIKLFDFLRITGFARELFVGEYGVITMALTYAVAIVFPIVGAFFLFFGVLEDSGYLPRLASMLDRFFRKFGLNGKAVLPLILGLGCGTMATLTTRVLEKPRERLIATLLLALAIPCSAQLGVILGILASAGADVFAIWFVTVVLVFSLVGFASGKLLPGSTSSFIIEIPPMRLPLFSNILQKVKKRVLWYLTEAVPLFIAGTLVLFLMDKIGALDYFIKGAEPVVKGALGLPAKAAEAFFVGFLRRDYGAAGLYDLARAGLLDKRQTAVSIVVITLFVPCLAQFLVMIKERGKKQATGIFIFVILFAVIVGAILNKALIWIRFS